MTFKPAYLTLYEDGSLSARIDALYPLLNPCTVCARKCGVNRLNGEEGYCRAGIETVVSSVFAHFGEERPLVGIHGSGTIFLSNCNLRCQFCQNYDISHYENGKSVDAEELAGMMISLQSSGCHNINFVTPTHYTPQIVAALPLAIERGLNVPLVYNCGGYEAMETLQLLDGIFDIYMPDAKFGDERWAQKLCDAEDYFEVNKAALKEMFRQVGDLKMDTAGVATRGLLIRHLVMPNNVAGSVEIIDFIAANLSKETYVNIMSQYRPCYRAHEFKEIARRPTPKELLEVVEYARSKGLYRGFGDSMQGFL